MLFILFGFTLGLTLVSFLPVAPSIWLLITSASLGIFLITISCLLSLKKAGLKTSLQSLGVLLLAFSWLGLQAHEWWQHRLSADWVGKDITVTGVIIQLPIEEEHYSRFLFQTEQFAGKKETKRLQLSWQKPHPEIHIGERWQLQVRLKPPHALVNFNLFNRLRWFWIQNIHATGYVIAKKSNQFLAVADGFWLGRWRQKLQQEIRSSVPDPSASAIITALTIGEETGLNNADWQTLQRTGTVHLVVIAGLHIGFMVLVVYFLVNHLWRCFPGWMLRVPAQQAAALVTLIFVIGYGSLVGFGIPTQRAVFMTVLLSLGQLLFREISAWRRAGLAYILVLIIDPGAIFSAGFWLSFAAIFWITYSLEGEWRQTPHWRQWLRIQWALFLGLGPLTIYFFQQFSLIAIFANLPAIVWIGWVIVPLCVIAACLSWIKLSASQFLFKFAAYLLKPLWIFLQWLASWPWAGQRFACSNIELLLIALLGAALCLMPRKKIYRWFGLVGFLPIWLIHPTKPPPASYWLTMLDVGQGLALIVQTKNHLLIYDTGPSMPDGFDAGRDVLSPYLLNLGAKKIDILMVSHGDNDHSGGAKYLLANWPVGQMLTSIPSLFTGAQAQYCTAGQQWQWDGVPFRVLWPPAGSEYQDNNSSCVLQIGVSGQRTLLTGDIEGITERALVEKYGSELNAQILSVPHHGSKTSSTLNFINLVNPKIALFSFGYFNRFHFPAPTVYTRYRVLGGEQKFTANNGAVRVNITTDSITLYNANNQKFFWQKVPVK